MRSKTIKVDLLARVEGEGALHVKINQGVLKEVQLKIFEPPRFFEAFLRGRDFREAPDITSRICGICPIAYQLSASLAMEEICGIKVEGQLQELRRLIYAGEWIESHVLHVFMLNAPDFFEVPSVVHLAQVHSEMVTTALRLKKLGNTLMAIVGGREVHPVNLRVGGFYKAPAKKVLRDLLPEIRWAREAAIRMAMVISGWEFREFTRDYHYMALSSPDTYAVIEGSLASNRGVDVPVSKYDEILTESHLAHSTALHSRTRDGGTCLMGPLARYNLNYDHLSSGARELAVTMGLQRTCHNPFRGIQIRMVELVHALDEAERIIEQYEVPSRSFMEVEPGAGTGYGCTEAPRGSCYHRYTINKEGIITDAKIVAPTSVNQGPIEEDLWDIVAHNMHLSDDQIKFICERAIRNYDPCISCSTHFLKLTVDRE